MENELANIWLLDSQILVYNNHNLNMSKKERYLTFELHICIILACDRFLVAAEIMKLCML